MVADVRGPEEPLRNRADEHPLDALGRLHPDRALALVAVLHREDLVAHLEARVADAAGLDGLRERQTELPDALERIGQREGIVLTMVVSVRRPWWNIRVVSATETAIPITAGSRNAVMTYPSSWPDYRAAVPLVNERRASARDEGTKSLDVPESGRS